jgi:IclR family transcriptional regulator, pca regulon regulatory protein
MSPILGRYVASTGLSRAADTARWFLRTLVQLGYMRSDGSRFALRPKILELGYAYLSSLTLPEVAMPHLEQLVEQVHESSSVSELDGDDLIYIARVPTKRIMTVTINIGTRFPATRPRWAGCCWPRSPTSGSMSTWPLSACAV